MDKRRRARGEDGPATEEGGDAEDGGGDWRVSASQAKLDELFLHWLALPEAQTYVKSLCESSCPYFARETREELRNMHMHSMGPLPADFLSRGLLHYCGLPWQLTVESSCHTTVIALGHFRFAPLEHLLTSDAVFSTRPCTTWGPSDGH